MDMGGKDYKLGSNARIIPEPLEVTQLPVL